MSGTQLSHTWLIFETSVPLIHVLATVRFRPKHAKWSDVLKTGLVWPLCGGNRSLVFHLLSVALFFASLLLSVVPRWSETTLNISQIDIVMASAAFAAVISALFMVKAALLFEPGGSGNGLEKRTRKLGFGRGRKRKERSVLMRFLWRIKDGGNDMKWDVTHMPSRHAAFWIIVGLGFVWTSIGVALLYSARLVNEQLAIAYSAFSTACFIIAATTTHGLGGRLMHAHKVEESHLCVGRDLDSCRTWHFFQPFSGGKVFVATQAAGWLLYSTSFAVSIWAVFMLSFGVAQHLKALHVALGGVSALFAEIILATSLLLWNVTAEGGGGLWSAAELDRKISTFLDLFNQVAIICVLYLNIHLPVSFVLFLFLIFPPMFVGSILIGALVIYYSITGLSSLETMGKGEWIELQKWIGLQAERFLPSWLGSFEIVLDSPETAKDDFNPALTHRKYVFGYVPHGLYPISAGFLPFTPTFRKLLPWLKPCTLTASITFQIPVIRDFMRWCGIRVVSRPSFERALNERGSVLIVPGGQAELVETWRMNKKINPEFCLYTRHKGFVRIALDQGASLVPILCFGEARSLRNLLDMPRMQRWTYRRLGFPIPFLIAGKFGFLPLPSRTGLRFIIGRPLHPPEKSIKDGKKRITQQEVDEMHRRFYKEIERIWLKHRKDSPGFEDMPLVMI